MFEWSSQDLTITMFDSKVNFLVIPMVVVLIAQQTCFARRLLDEASITLQSQDKNRICQQDPDHGPDYVWDKHIQTCVRCTTCTPGASDPHCITCCELGIIQHCSSSTTTPPQVNEGNSTPTPPPLPSTLTMPSSSWMNSTSGKNVANDSNTESIALKIVLPCLGATSIFILVFLMYKCRKGCTSKQIAPPISQAQQETGSPAESHPMVVKFSDDLGNQETTAV